MSTPLRVLIVEDSEDDALLLVQELRRGGYAPTHERLDTAEAMHAALDEQSWDIVICDYVMPRFSGLAALKLLQERGLDLPFIIVSGKIGENVAVEAMKAGAHDYIMKGNLARLVPAIERGLEEAKGRRARREAEQALQRSNEELLEMRRYLASLIESSTDAIISTDKRGNVVLFNRGAKALLGYHRDEVIGKCVMVLYESEERAKEVMRLMREGGGTVSAFETTLRARDGSLIPVLISASILYDEDGQEVGTVGFNKDLRERKQAEEAVRQLSRQNELILNSAGEGIYGLDLDGNTTFINPAAARMIGWEVEELIGQPQHDIQHYSKPDGTPYPRQECPIHAAYKDGLVRHKSDEVFWRKDGTSFPVEYVSTPIRDESGELVGAVVTFKDISERKQAEEAVRESQARLAAILDIADDAIISVDEAQRITLFNQGAEKMFGYRAEEVLGQPLDILLPELFEEAHREHVRGFAASPIAARMMGELGSLIGRRKDGTEFPAEGSISKLELKGEKVFTTFFRDVTERAQAEEELRQHRDRLEELVGERTEELHASLERLETANLQLEEADRHKSRFLSSVSHELRTPLNAILGFADLLHGQHYGPLNEKQDEYIAHIDSSGKHLLALINDLLDITKIDAGRMEVRLRPLSLDELIRTVTTMMSTQFNENGLTLDVEVADLLKQPFLWDEKLSKQILFNLLSNAVKFTPEGGRVAVRAVAENSWVRVTVSDTGIGIPPDQRDKIFSEFHQVIDYVYHRGNEGTGIGLPLTRRLVELLGGEIGVDSEPGRGSAFTFTLPLRRPTVVPEEDAEMEERSLDVARRGCRILVAEDNEVNLAMLLDMLTTQEHEVAVAHNGREAVDLARSFRPDLVLMDVKMPVMDGLEATRQIRRMAEFAALPIIALTATAGEEAKRRCLEAGCTEHLVKPVQSAELFAALGEYL